MNILNVVLVSIVSVLVVGCSASSSSMKAPVANPVEIADADLVYAVSQDASYDAVVHFDGTPLTTVQTDEEERECEAAAVAQKRDGKQAWKKSCKKGVDKSTAPTRIDANPVTHRGSLFCKGASCAKKNRLTVR